MLHQQHEMCIRDSLDKYHEMQRQYQVLERRMEDRNSQAAARES